jgi:hypothetical protein
MYVYSKTEARSLRDCSRVKAISITYYECVFVSLPHLPGMQIAPFLRRITLLSIAVWLCGTFRHYLINGTIFGKGN